MSKRPNDCGVGWKKTNDLGNYYSLALDLDALLVLTQGEVGKVNLNMYPIVSDNPKAPDFQLKFYPKGGQGGTMRRPASGTTRPSAEPEEPPLPDDDDIPF